MLTCPRCASDDIQIVTSEGKKPEKGETYESYFSCEVCNEFGLIDELKKVIRVHDYVVGGGVRFWAGKSHYPDCLTVHLPANRVLDLMRSLIGYLEYSERHDGAQDPFELAWMGEYTGEGEEIS